MKKIIAAILALTLVLCMFAGCGSSGTDTATPAADASAPDSIAIDDFDDEDMEDSAAEDDSAIEEEETDSSSAEFEWGEYEFELPLTDGATFDYWMSSQPFMMTYSGQLDDYSALPFYTSMEDLTGVHLNVVVQSLLNSQEQFNLMFASGDYPDMFEGEYTNGSGAGIEDDVILSLNDYLDDCMPNYKNWLQHYPKARATATTDDGDLYCAANIVINNSGQIQGPMLRGDWLEEAGLDLPQTYDDLHNVLVAFKEAGHPNSFWMTSALQVTFNCWSAGYDAINEMSLNEDGEVIYGPIVDGYREYVTMLHDWYEEGLIYQDFTTISQYADSIDTGIVLDGTIGVWSGDTTRMEVLESEDLKISAFTYPTINPGEMVHIAQNEEVVGQGTSISTQCSDPELVCKFLDYLYTYDGFILSNYGEEGVAFTYDEEGTPNLTDLVIRNPDFITPVGFILYTKFSGAGICDNRRSTLAYTERNFADVELWASNTSNDHMLPKNSILNTEEALTSATIINEVDTYVEENLLRFVVGDLSLDQWDAYVADIKAMGIDEAIEIYQGAYERYLTK